KQVLARCTQVKCLSPERQRRIRAHRSDEALRARIVDPIARGHDGQVMLQQKLLGNLQGQLPGHIDPGRRYGQLGRGRRRTLPPCLGKKPQPWDEKESDGELRWYTAYLRLPHVHRAILLFCYPSTPPIEHTIQ